MKESNCQSICSPSDISRAELITLPPGVQFFPLTAPVHVTQGLLQSLLEGSRFIARDELLRDLSTSLTFALLGLIGYEPQNLGFVKTLLVPIACGHGHWVMRLSLHEKSNRIALSLPDEHITCLA